MSQNPKQLNPLINSDKTYPEQRNGEYVLPATIDLLPAVFHTDTNKKLLNAVMEDMFQPHAMEDLNYAVGRKTSKVNFKDYLPHATAKRQLETGVIYYRDTGVETLSADEVAQGWGLNDRTKEDPVPVSILDLPIDPDKFVNWVDYYWIDEGMPVIYLNGGEVSTFNVLDDIIGKKSFTTPTQRNGKTLELQNGMRIVFQQFPGQQDINGARTIQIIANGTQQQDIPADFAAYDKTKIDITVYANNEAGDQFEYPVVNGVDFVVYGSSIFWLRDDPPNNWPMDIIAQDYYVSTTADDMQAQRRWQVSGVGSDQGIRLLSRTHQYTNTTYSKASSNLWDQTAQPWDSIEWDGINRGVNQKHYILMQSGARNRNANSRVNVWIHKATIQTTADFLGILVSDIIKDGSQALRPIVEFENTLEMNRHGTTFRAWPNFVVDTALVNASEFVGLPLTTEGVILALGYSSLLSKLKIDVNVTVTLVNGISTRTALNKATLTTNEFDTLVLALSPVVIYSVVNDTIHWEHNEPTINETVTVAYRIGGVPLANLRILWLAAGEYANKIINVVAGTVDAVEQTKNLYTVQPLDGDAITIDIPDATSKYYLREYYWKDGIALPAQTRVSFTQQPLFELYDATHEKLSNLTPVPQITSSRIIDIVTGTVADSESGYNLSFLPSQFKKMTDGNPAKNAMYDIMYNHTQQTPINSSDGQSPVVIRGPYHFRRFVAPANTAAELSNGYRKAWFRLKSAVIKTLPVDNSQVTLDASAWPAYEWTIAPINGIAKVLHSDNFDEVVGNVAVVARGEVASFKLTLPTYRTRVDVIELGLALLSSTDIFSFTVPLDAPSTLTLSVSESNGDSLIALRVINVEQDPRAPQVLLDGLPTNYTFRDIDGYRTSTISIPGYGTAEIRHQGDQVDSTDHITAVPGLDYNPTQNINFGEFTPSRVISAFNRNIKINEQANTAWVNSPQWSAMDGAIMADHSSMRSAWTSFKLEPTIQDSIIGRASSSWAWHRKFMSRLDYFNRTQDLEAMLVREALDLVLEDLLIGVTYSSQDAVSGMALTTSAMSTVTHSDTGPLYVEGVTNPARSFVINTGSATLYTGAYGTDHVYVYVNDELVTREKYTIIDGMVVFGPGQQSVYQGATIVIYHASEMAIYSGIPASPTKLGLHGLVRPEFVTDVWDNGQSPQSKTYIKRHDNSRVAVYFDHTGSHVTDIRNKIILELENRIYSVCLENPLGTVNRQQQLNNFDVNSPSESQVRSMIEWFAEHNVDYQDNSKFDATDPWTWNYSGQSWEGLYITKFGTTQLDSRPWEALGFDEEPSWWINHYSWTDEEKRPGLEYALQGGIISEPGQPLTIDPRVARSMVSPSDGYPVDTDGKLMYPSNSQWEGAVPEPSLGERAAPWTIGSRGGPELVWRRSVAGAWAGVLYSIDHYNIFNKFFDTAINPFIRTVETNSPKQKGYSSIAPLDFLQGRPTIGIGAALFEANREFNLPGETPLHEIIGLSPRLQFGFGGFTDNAMSLKMYYTKYQTGSYVPVEDYFVNLSSGVLTDILRYSSVRVEKSEFGYRLYGFDPGLRYFTIYTPVAIETGIRYAADRRIVSTQSGDLTQYLKWGTTPVNVAYGTYFANLQELFTFFQGLQEYQAAQGLILDTINSRNTVDDWIQAALDAIRWVSEGWGSSHYCIVGVANANGLKIKHTRGILERLDSARGRSGKVIFNDGYSAVSADIQIIRDYEPNVDKIVPIIGKQIVFAKLQAREYEHIVYLNLKTKFGDLLVDTQTGNRLNALQLSARRTQQWTGRPHAPGALVQKTNLLPGFDALVSDIINSHKVELNGFDTFKAKLGRADVIPAKFTVVDELIQDYNTATLYRQGVQSSAGTTLSVEALFRNREIDIPGRVQDVTLSESWLFATGQFGNMLNDKFWEFELRVADIVSQRQIIRFSDSNVGLRSDNIIDITKNDGRWVTKPPEPYKFATLDRATQTNVDQIESWMPNAGVAKLFEANIQKRDLNSLTLVDFLQIDQSVAASAVGQTYTGPLTTAALFSVNGFSRYNDYQPGDFVWNSGVLYSAKVKIIGSSDGVFDGDVAWTTIDIESGILPSIWVSDYGFELTSTANGYGWNMLQVFSPMYVEESCPNALNTGLNESKITFQLPHGFNEGEFFILSGGNDGNYDAVHKVKAVVDDFNILIAARSTGDQIVYNMVAFKMLPVKFNNLGALESSMEPESGYVWKMGMYAYIDNEGSGQSSYNQSFTVFRVTNPAATDLDVFLAEISSTTIIDTAALYNAKLVDYDTGNVITSLEIYDPFKGITVDKVAQYINYKVPVDPAVYNIDELGIQDLYVSAPWGKHTVGKLWWDLNAVRYIEYEQGTLEYRAENWGKQFADSEVAIYEWTASTDLPDETVPNIKLDYSSGVGQIRYSVIDEINSTTGGPMPTYYYWIRHPETLPPAVARSISAMSIESILNDPDSNGVAWLAPINSSETSASILLSNFTSFLATRDKVILRIEQISKPEQRHTTGELITEGKNGTVIPNNLYQRMRDSLVSFNETKTIKLINTFTVGNSYAAGDIISYYSASSMNITQPVQYSKNDIPILPNMNSTRQDVSNVWVNDSADAKFGLFVVIGPITNARAWSEISHKLSKIVTPITQVVDQFIDNRFYAVIDKSTRVPDSRLHVKRRYGNNIIPYTQSWFNDISSARRTFITAVNAYLLKIDTVSKAGWDTYLRVVQGVINAAKLHIDPDYDRTTGIENIDYAMLNGEKSFFHIPIWDYVDYTRQGTQFSNKYIKLTGLQELAKPIYADISEFAIINANGVITDVYTRDSDGNLTLNYRKNGTIQFRTLWDTVAWDTAAWESSSWDLGYDNMFNVILKALRNNIFTKSDIDFFNLIFFDMVKEALAQDPAADWVTKTTYVNVEQISLNDLMPVAIFYDKKEALVNAYINEVKPFHSKVIDDGIISKSTVDLPIVFNELVKFIITQSSAVYVVVEDEQLIDRRRDGNELKRALSRLMTESGELIVTEETIDEVIVQFDPVDIVQEL